ncbi:MAG TPA: hypothetical protein VGV09_14245 [Steroidobacteraceae bacterium]|nr:hypothetical protein [Steroidobacteraceae bacterium]
MKTSTMAAVAGIVLGALITVAHAQSGSHAGRQLKRGREIALDRCATCYVVA